MLPNGLLRSFGAATNIMGSPFALAVATKRDLLWGGVFGCGVGLVFLFYGLTRKPLELNSLNLWKKPIPVWAARVVYLPMAALSLFFGVRDIIRALR
jgi:hypothetical protein